MLRIMPVEQITLCSRQLWELAGFYSASSKEGWHMVVHLGSSTVSTVDFVARLLGQQFTGSMRFYRLY